MHMSSILVPVVSEAISKPLVLVALVSVTVVYLSSEFLRLRGKSIPFITAFTLQMSRLGEKEHLILRPTYLALGVILVLLLFPTNVAYASIAVVALGDPVAGLIGGRFGRIKYRGRSIEGFAFGLIAAFAGASIWITPMLALWGALAGMGLEFSGIFEDNLTIPIGAALTMLLLGNIFTMRL